MEPPENLADDLRDRELDHNATLGIPHEEVYEEGQLAPETAQMGSSRGSLASAAAQEPASHPDDVAYDLDSLHNMLYDGSPSKRL